jgi:hypothetical protein
MSMLQTVSLIVATALGATVGYVCSVQFGMAGLLISLPSALLMGYGAGMLPFSARRRY